MWDNTRTEKTNPNQPDYKCKDVDNCGYVEWLDNTTKNAEQAAAPAATTTAVRPVVLDSLWVVCWKAAGEILREHTDKQTAEQYTVGDRINLSNSLFDARSRHTKGILKMEKEIVAKRQQEAAEAERRRQEEERARTQQHAGPTTADGYPVSDDLPF